jgi:predicted protein tyrosine phosphatase
MSSQQSNSSTDSKKIYQNEPVIENVDGEALSGCDNEPSWIYNNLSWYLTWMWGKARGYGQPLVSNRYSADCVYSERVHGSKSDSNFEIHLGGIPSLYNKERLLDTKITHILTAILGVGKQYSKDKDGFTTLNIPVRDVEWEHLDKYFDKAVDFMKECESDDGRVFVHCMCGVSRSSTLVAAFLIREKGMSAHDAIEHLHSYRNKVDPNKGFRQQLENYEKAVKLKNKQ